MIMKKLLAEVLAFSLLGRPVPACARGISGFGEEGGGGRRGGDYIEKRYLFQPDRGGGR